MKKTTPFVLIAAVAMLFASCGKDKDLLTHGIVVRGVLSPDFQIPLAYGEMNLDDLLTKFGGEMDAYITDDDVITFTYSYSQSDHLEVGGMIATPAAKTPIVPMHKPLATKDDYLVSQDTVFEYTFPIDFFSQVDILQESNIKLKEVLLNGLATVRGDCPDNVRDQLRQYVSARIDSLYIQYVDRYGNARDFGVIEGSELETNDLTATNQFPIVANLAQIINDLPQEISVGFRLHVDVEEDFLNNNIQNVQGFTELLDSLKMTTLDYSVDVDLKLPFEVQIGQLGYAFDVDLNQGDGEVSNILDQIDSTISAFFGENSGLSDETALYVILRLKNGIPLNLNLDGRMLDENGLTVLNFIDTTVPSAQTQQVAGMPGVYEASASTPIDIEVPLNLDDARKFLSASQLKLTLGLTTDGIDADQYNRVKRSDNLEMKVFIRLNPQMDINWDVPGLENGVTGIFEGIPVIGSLIGNLFN